MFMLIQTITHHNRNTIMEEVPEISLSIPLVLMTDPWKEEEKEIT